MLRALKAFVKTVARPITYASESLLLFAVNNNFNRLSTLLIKCGVDVNCNNSEGTPLWHAVNNGNLYLVKILLDNNADVNSQANKDSRTVLHLAAQKKDPGCLLREDYILKNNNDIIDALIKVKPKMDLHDRDGQTPLHIAVNRCYLFATKAFIKEKANLNLFDNNKKTPIMSILDNISNLSNNPRTILRVLILAGARLDLIDNSNRTVLQKVADYHGDIFEKHLICKTLLFYGAKLEELKEKIHNNGSFAHIMFKHQSSLEKSVDHRKSISEKMHALHTKKINRKTISMLRSHKLEKIPERLYPDHNRIAVEKRDLEKKTCNRSNLSSTKLPKLSRATSLMQ